MELNFSKYNELFDILIEKENLFREIKEKVDLTFVYDELKDNYSSTMGRTSEDVVRMFKYLILKSYYKISDRELVRRTKTDMEFKYFLDYDVEELNFIDPSLLTKFRRERIKTEDTANNLLDKLLKKTVELALESGIIKNKVKVILDSTHTMARYGKLSPREELIRQARNLRKSVYAIDESLKAKMPAKREASGILEDMNQYVDELLEVVKKEEILTKIGGIREQIDYLEETNEDIKEALSTANKKIPSEYSKDPDARTGHKTADTSFFGYKNHLAMTTEGIITAATVTSGEKNDGQEMQRLIEKTEDTGLEIEAVIGDGAYSSHDDIEYCKDKGIKVVSKLNKMILEGHGSKEESGYTYNKDADMYVCKAGHMAIRKSKDKCGSKNRDVIRYYFDVEKCRICPFREGCYKAGAKKKSMTVTVKKDIYKDQIDYMDTNEFKELYKERYKIEAKNSQIKNIGDMKKAVGCGELGMTIQGATTLFLANIKRIRTLNKEKNKNKGDNDTKSILSL